MIQRLSHTTLYVTDHDQAHEFYVGKLGLEVRTDQTMGSFRWLTVGPKGQPELEIVLMKIGSQPGGDEASAAQFFDLLRSGKLAAAGVFDTADCRKTYEELKERGVEFLKAPADEFYGVEAVFRDPFGNSFSLTQPK